MAEKVENEKRNITVFGEETEFDGVLEFSDHLVITGNSAEKLMHQVVILKLQKMQPVRFQL